MGEGKPKVKASKYLVSETKPEILLLVLQTNPLGKAGQNRLLKKLV